MQESCVCTTSSCPNVHRKFGKRTWPERVRVPDDFNWPHGLSSKITLPASVVFLAPLCEGGSMLVKSSETHLALEAGIERSAVPPWCLSENYSSAFACVIFISKRVILTNCSLKFTALHSLTFTRDQSLHEVGGNVWKEIPKKSKSVSF